MQTDAAVALPYLVAGKFAKTPVFELKKAKQRQLPCFRVPLICITQSQFPVVYYRPIKGLMRSMTVLAPCPGELPSKYLIIGSSKWM